MKPSELLRKFYGRCKFSTDVEMFVDNHFISKEQHDKKIKGWIGLYSKDELKLAKEIQELKKDHQQNIKEYHAQLSVLKERLPRQKVLDLIDEVYKDLDMGKTIPIFIERLKQKLKEIK